MIKKGTKVYWIDPALDDYPPDEVLDALKRIFTVDSIKGDMVCISDGHTEAEVLLSELIPVNS